MERVGFDGGPIADYTAPVDLGRAGDGGYFFRCHTAGAAFRGGQGQTGFQEFLYAAFRQVRHIHAIDHIPQKPPHIRQHRDQHGLRLFRRGSLGGCPEPDLRGLCVGCQGRIGHMGHFLMKKLVDGAFPHAEGHNIMGDNGVMGEFPKIGFHVPPEHGGHFVRRSGEHKDMDAAGFKRAAGSGAHGVIKNDAVLGQFGLLGIVFGHRDMEGGFIEKADVLQNIGMEDEPFPKGLADGLFGEVVVSRPQPAGGQDDIRPASGDLQGFPEAFRVIAHDGMPKDVDAQGGQALGEVLGVGIGDIAQKQLCTHGNDFCGMRHGIPSLLYIIYGVLVLSGLDPGPGFPLQGPCHERFHIQNAFRLPDLLHAGPGGGMPGSKDGAAVLIGED